MFVGVGVVFAFGVEDSNGLWQDAVGHVVVTDDEIDTFAFGIGYLIYRFDTTVEHNHQSNAS